ncbi:MAG TPA: potassium-transporting ATPase subunit KdpA, partial [Gammaproteobacteria bacterium]|nr:potassium-transporting ATPase subunit KdpA [Gammaproteobacteria bacterium]
GVMLFCMILAIAWTICFDTLRPNPGLTQQSTRMYIIPHPNGANNEINIPSVGGLPVDQKLGNLEGKELRFGTAAGAMFAAITTNVTCGAVNAEADSLNPLASLAPFAGMWMNSFFGGKGVGMINMLLFIIVGIFLAGMMVGRTPEYLGKKIGPREIKLAIIAMLVHPFMILLPLGLFAATKWGLDAISNPGAHGLAQMLYQFTSAAANNGSAFDGLKVTYGFFNNSNPPPAAIVWDIATGLVMIFGRFMPIIAPLAMASYLGAKKSTQFGMGTLRVDTLTFAFLLLGTMAIIGALLFLPAAALGPVAEHLGPMPFGGG